MPHRYFQNYWLLLRRPRVLFPILILIGIGTLLIVFITGEPDNLRFHTFQRQAFQRLQSALDEKKTRTLQLLEEQRNLAKGVADEEEFIAAFKRMHGMFRQRQYGSPAFLQEERAWEERFVSSLGMFYDLLLLDNLGNIFFTIKQESDFLTNIHDPRYTDLELYRAYKKPGREPRLVEFEFYPASEEPAGFWLVPIFDGTRRLGMIALQFPIHLFNRIFTERSGLGKTGEVYLVDSSRIMLTESRFINSDPESHRIRVETLATINALEQSPGSRILRDYRGKPVFSVYERIDYLGTTMVIIAEIDEAEILGDYFLTHETQLFPRLLAWLARRSESLLTESTRREDLPRGDGFIKVDVQEYRKGMTGQTLSTNGVSTCTAFAAYIPGTVGYMAHIPPTDQAYGLPLLSKYMLGLSYTSLAEEVTSKVMHFDLRPADHDQLRFALAATQSGALLRIVRMLLTRGISPYQIKIAFDPTRESVSVALNYEKDLLQLYWRSPTESGYRPSGIDQWPDLGEALKAILLPTRP